MFCPKCGKEITSDSKFCEYCGYNISVSPNNLTPTKSQVLFYGKDWTKSGLFIASIPYFDIILTNEFLYLIEFHTSKASGFGIVGGLVGVYIGSMAEKREREQTRSHWINSNGELITNEYENNYQLKIPVTELKNVFVIDGNKITITFQGEKITLKGQKKEANRLLQILR